MLKLRKFPKRSPNWYIRGTVADQRVLESTGTTDKAAADAYRRRREVELHQSAPLGTTPPKSAPLGMKPPTTFSAAARAYKNSGGEARFLEKISDEIGDTPVADIRQATVDDLAAKLYPDAAASTINRQLITPIITVIRHAVVNEMTGAVLRSIKRRRELKPVIRPATDDHIDKLLPHLPVGLRALIVMMTFTGLRTGEALRVTEADIRDGYIHVGRTKNGDARMTPVPEGWEYPAGGWGYQTTQGVGQALQRAHKAAELPYRDGHELGRHGFAARFLKAGGNIKQLKEAGGWKKLAVVDETYGHLEMSDVHDFMRTLSRRP